MVLLIFFKEEERIEVITKYHSTESRVQKVQKVQRDEIWYPRGILQVHRVICGNMGNVMVYRGTLSVAHMSLLLLLY